MLSFTITSYQVIFIRSLLYGHVYDVYMCCLLVKVLIKFLHKESTQVTIILRVFLAIVLGMTYFLNASTSTSVCSRPREFKLKIL